MSQAIDFIGAPGEIRTPDHQIRSLEVCGQAQQMHHLAHRGGGLA
jgi:hypothetical protein